MVREKERDTSERKGSMGRGEIGSGALAAAGGDGEELSRARVTGEVALEAGLGVGEPGGPTRKFT